MKYDPENIDEEDTRIMKKVLNVLAEEKVTYPYFEYLLEMLKDEGRYYFGIVVCSP